MFLFIHFSFSLSYFCLCFLFYFIFHPFFIFCMFHACFFCFCVFFFLLYFRDNNKLSAFYLSISSYLNLHFSFSFLSLSPIYLCFYCTCNISLFYELIYPLSIIVNIFVFLSLSFFLSSIFLFICFCFCCFYFIKVSSLTDTSISSRSYLLYCWATNDSRQAVNVNAAANQTNDLRDVFS